MTGIVLLAPAVMWIANGVYTYGITFAFLQRGWPELARRQRWLDFAFSVFFGAFGPVGMIVIFVVSGGARYGTKFRMGSR